MKHLLIGFGNYKSGDLLLTRRSERRYAELGENTRKIFQNQFAHDLLTCGKTKWFEVLSLKSRWYWGFGYSGGSTLY